MSCRSVFCCLSNNYMISFKSSKCNIISQSQYDSEIRRICSCSPVPVSLVSVIASLSHHQFSAFQNTFYPLTDRFLYSLIKRFRKISQDAHPLLRIFYLYQHDGDTFFLLNTSSIDKYNMPL